MTEEQFNKYMEQRENLAWQRVKQKMFRDIKVPPELEKILKYTFCVGYDVGSMDEEIMIRKLFKEDPIKFYEWLQSE